MPEDKPKRAKRYASKPQRAEVQKHVATEIRDKLPARIHVDWHLAIMSGFNPKLAQDPETGELYIEVPDYGIEPTLAEKTASQEWLAKYCYGTAPATHVVENILRIEGAGQQGPSFKNLSPAAIRAMRSAIRLTLGTASAEPAPTTSDPRNGAIDAEFTDGPAPGGNQREARAVDEISKSEE